MDQVVDLFNRLGLPGAIGGFIAVMMYLHMINQRRHSEPESSDQPSNARLQVEIGRVDEKVNGVARQVSEILTDIRAIRSEISQPRRSR